MFRLGEIQIDEGNEGGAIKYYEQAVTFSKLHLKEFSGTKKQLVEYLNKRAEIHESWASLVAGTNRAEELKEAQTFREKARQISAEIESGKKKCETA